MWREETLQIVSTANASTPLVRGDVALLALDLWEHAYYLDFQNRRAAYVNAFLEDLVDWDCANQTLIKLAARSPTRAATLQGMAREHAVP